MEKPRFYTYEMLIKPLVAPRCQLQQPSKCIYVREQNFPDELFLNSQPTETILKSLSTPQFKSINSSAFLLNCSSFLMF